MHVGQPEDNNKDLEEGEELGTVGGWDVCCCARRVPVRDHDRALPGHQDIMRQPHMILLMYGAASKNETMNS